MIDQISTTEIYKSRWMRVREDEVKFPNGKSGLFGVVEKPDFSLIIPFENNGFHIVKQYRYPVSGAYWEFPQGSYEDGEIDPVKNASKELEEETGLIASELAEIGYLYEAYGYCDQGFHIYLAQNFSKGMQRLEDSESDLVTKWVSLEEFEKMIDEGEIRDAPTVASYSLFLRKRKSN